MRYLHRSLFAAVISVLLVASACSPAAPATPAAVVGGTVKLAVTVDAGALEPRLMADTAAYRVVDMVFDGLVYLDGKLKPQPALAEKWSNPEPTVWLFNLRKGVKWHDGKDFTASDVAYSFTSLLDPNFKSPQRSLYAAIKSVEAVDASTVKFTTDGPYAPILSYMDIGIVPKHIGEKNDGSLNTSPIGTGPFKFVSRTKNAKIEFAANKDWWGGAPKLDKVEFVIIPDTTNGVNALIAGDVDIVQAPIFAQDIPRLRDNKNITFTVYDGIAITYLNFNVSDPLMSDVRVRQAIASLVDRDTISKTIYQGIDVPAQSILAPISFAYTKDITGPAYDQKKAADYLTAAGYKLEGGTWKKDGKDLAITLNTQSDDSGRVQTAEYLQNVFTKFGIKVNVSLVEFGTFLANTSTGKYQIALIGWNTVGLDPDKFYPMFTKGGSSNWGKYDNAEVAQLMVAGRAETDQAKRTTIYQKVAKTIADDAVYHVLQYQGNSIAMSNKLKGFEFNGKTPMAVRSLSKVFLTK